MAAPGISRRGENLLCPSAAAMRHRPGAAIERCDSPIELDAQSYLRDWYRRFGFEQNGKEFIEDGIPHIPMRRDS